METVDLKNQAQLETPLNPSQGFKSPLSAQPTPAVFKISPLIRITLGNLYVALTIPLPFLSKATGASVPAQLLWLGIGVGGVALHAVLSQQVVLDQDGIQVTYPAWIPRFLRRGWSLSWSEITALKPRSTGQGGLVYYLLSKTGEAYLLPMRIAGFSRLVQQVEKQTGIDTRDVCPLSQPWMYFTLLGLTLMLLAIDGWTIWTAMGHLS